MVATLVFAGIAPHPPLLVPEIGGHRISKVERSFKAMQDFSRRLLEADPETIVLISPHSPLDWHAFTTRADAELYGDFRQFDAGQVRLKFNNDLELVNAIGKEAEAAGVPFKTYGRSYLLDHGAMVPLYFLAEAGWRGPVVVLAFSGLSIGTHVEFGRCITRAAEKLGRRIAVVASGDLSHRLIPTAPAGYEPEAYRFDQLVTDSVARGDCKEIIEMDPDLRELAGECGYRSIAIALGSIDEKPVNNCVLSYEGPYGVGYLVAILAEGLSQSAVKEQSIGGL